MNLTILPQRKLLFGNENDMGYHVNEFGFVSFKIVVFGNILKLAEFWSNDVKQYVNV